MFQFITLGVFLLSGTGVLVVGTGGYVVLQNKDLIKTSIVEQDVSSNALNKEFPSSIKKFQELQQESLKKQEEISKLEKDLSNLKSKTLLLSSNISTLKKEVENKDKTLNNWKDLIKDSEAKITALTKKKDEQRENVVSKETIFNDKTRELEQLKTQTKTITDNFTQASQALENAYSSHEQAKTKLSEHQEKLKISTADLAKINSSISSLTTQSEKKGTDISDKSKLIKADQDSQTQKSTEIKGSINSYVLQLEALIKQLASDIEALNKEITTLTDPKDQTTKTQKEQTSSDKAQLKKTKEEEKNKFQNIDSTDQNNLCSFFATNIPSDNAIKNKTDAFISTFNGLKINIEKLEKEKQFLDDEKTGLDAKIRIFQDQVTNHESKTLSTGEQTLTDAVTSYKDVYDSAKDKMDESKSAKQTNLNKVNQAELDKNKSKEVLEEAKKLEDIAKLALNDETKNKQELEKNKDIAEKELETTTNTITNLENKHKTQTEEITQR